MRIENNIIESYIWFPLAAKKESSGAFPMESPTPLATNAERNVSFLIWKQSRRRGESKY